MNRIFTGFITSTVEQPFTGPSLDFLQDATKDQINMICRAMIQHVGYVYSSSIPYEIYRLSSQRYIFFNGELYFMQPVAGGNVIAVISTTYAGPQDPLTFTDGIARNVHKIIQLDPQAGSPGAGLFDLADIVPIWPINDLPSLLNSWVVNGPDPGTRQIGTRIELSGGASKATNNSGILMVVPAPSVFRSISVNAIISGVGTIVPSVINIDPSGNVSFVNAIASGVEVYFDGLSYLL